MRGSRSRSGATRLVLPAPDGAASTNRHPEAGGALVGDPSVVIAFPPDGAAIKARRRLGSRRVIVGRYSRCHGDSKLFEVLHLLAHLLDQDLELERRLREFGIHRFRAQRVRLAVELLHEEIESLARAAPGAEHAADLGDV